MAEKFKDMDTFKSSYSSRVMCLTHDTSNALHLTLNIIVSLIKLLLNKDFNCVLPRSFQSDRFEEEYGNYCQSLGGY